MEVEGNMDGLVGEWSLNLLFTSLAWLENIPPQILIYDKQRQGNFYVPSVESPVEALAVQ